MIGRLPSGKYRLHSRKKDPKTGRRRNLSTFSSCPAAEKHERSVQYFKVLVGAFPGCGAALRCAADPGSL